MPLPPRLAPNLALHVPGHPDIHLSRYRGRLVLLAFLSTGCESCQRFALNELGPIQKQYGPKGVQILGAVFNKEAPAGFENFKTRFAPGFPCGLSDEVTVLKWLNQPPEEGYFTPMAAFINQRGYIVSQHLGDDLLFQNPGKNVRLRLDDLVRNL